MWCCTGQAALPVIRRRVRPRLNASTQLTLSKANILWMSKTGQALASWRRSKETQKANSTLAVESLKAALQLVGRRLILRKFRAKIKVQTELKRTFRAFERFANFALTKCMREWRFRVQELKGRIRAQERRGRALLFCLRRNAQLLRQEGLSLWHRSITRHHSVETQSKIIAVFKLFTELKTVLRRTIFGSLIRKPTVKLTLKRIFQSADRFCTSKVAHMFFIWRQQVDQRKSDQTLNTQIKVATLALHLRLQIKAISRDGFQRWKSALRNEDVQLRNGGTKSVTFAAKSIDRKDSVRNLAVWTPFHLVKNASVSLYRMEPMNVCLRVDQSERNDKEMKLMKTALLTLSKSAKSSLAFAFTHWNAKSQHRNLGRQQYLHTVRELVSMLSLLKINRIRDGFLSFKTPEKCLKLRKILKTLLKHYKLIAQKRFYQWIGSAKSRRKMKEIGGFQLFNSLKSVVKKRSLIPLMSATAFVQRQREHMLTTNRIFQRRLGFVIRRWKLKALEVSFTRVQNQLKVRRFRGLILTWIGKEKAFWFNKFRNGTSRRRLIEKCILKMLTKSRKRLEMQALELFRTKTKQVSLLYHTLKILPKLFSRRMSQSISHWRSVTRTRLSVTPVQDLRSSYLDFTMQAIKSTLDFSPTPRSSAFSSIFRA